MTYVTPGGPLGPLYRERVRSIPCPIERTVVVPAPLPAETGTTVNVAINWRPPETCPHCGKPLAAPPVAARRPEEA